MSSPSRRPQRWLTLLLLLCDGAHGGTRRKRKRRGDASDDTATQESMRHHQAGVMAHVQGDPAGAVAAFRRAIATKPDFAYAYYRLGFVLEEQRRRGSTRAPSGDALDAFRAAVAAPLLHRKRRVVEDVRPCARLGRTAPYHKLASGCPTVRASKPPRRILASARAGEAHRQ